MMNFPPASRLFRPSTARAGAFTIIELIVAMSIATIMMFLINQIFFHTTNAVSRGIGLSHIIGESRAISSTLETDFIADQIVKPAAGGFMFIGFKQYNNVDFANPRRVGQAAIQQDVTSDQMLLVLDIAGQARTPLTPRDDSTFSPYPSTPNHGLLWYGHVARLNPTSIVPLAPPIIGGSDAGELDNPTRNRFGHQWIVGRQLMFLDPAAAVAGAAHVDGPYARNFIAGYTVPAAITPTTRWMGLSDIINRDLDYFTTGPAVAGPPVDLPVLQPNGAALTPGAYLAEVARIAYVTERLRVAATVEPSTNPANIFESWNLAQTHAAFMSYCSDFQISFAGNFDATAGIDLEETLSIGSGDIRDFAGGNIKWYGYPANDPSTGAYDDTKPTLYEPDPATIPIFAGATDEDPYVADDVALKAAIETNMGVAPGSLSPIQVDNAVVFRHGSGGDVTTQWPHLIRIRYRLHDERGEIESTNGNQRAQGIWFEQIMRIQ